MRHGKKFNHLGRTSSHRKAMLSNMASSLILHKRITTTVAKAKELRKYVEPLITKSKADTTHSRRVVFSYLQNKESAHELFNEVATKVANRPGGYTRIIKLGNRLGDNADMCLIELVDYNEIYTTEKATKRTRRSRRGGKKKEGAEETQAKSGKAAASKEKEQAEEQKAAAQTEAPAEEESQDKADDTPKAKTDNQDKKEEQ